MKHFYTVLSVLFFALSATAQLTETFENYNSLASNCWKVTAMQPLTGNLVLEGASSISTQGTDTAIISTPYLDMTGTSLVSFRYRINNKLNQNATRKIEIGTTDKNNTFVAAQTLTLDKNTSHTSDYLFSQNINFSGGTKRFTIRVTAQQGDGNSNLIIDELSVSAVSLHYNPQTCNTAPVATNAQLSTVVYAPFNGDLRPYASDANAGETLAFTADSLLTNYGTLVVNADGTFVFTPNGNFSGGDVIFTYHVTDNGYDPLPSTPATVTISFAATATLPVHVSSFSGSLANQKAHLAWSVTQNEDGNAFEIEKSGDGSAYTSIGMVATTQKSGAEQYKFIDAQFSNIAYYRLKSINKTGVVTYSKTVVLKEKGAASNATLTLLQNPVASAINLSYNATTAGTATIRVYMTTGVNILSTHVNVQRGVNQVTLQANNKMVPGAYILEVINGSERNIVKLVKL